MTTISLCFRFLDGPRAHGDALELSLPSIKVGSNPTCPLSLEGDGVARLHAAIEVHQEAGKVLILDLGSQFGTFVNGTKVTKAVLKPHDRIAIGQHLFAIESALVRTTAPKRYGPSTRCLHCETYTGETNLDTLCQRCSWTVLRRIGPIDLHHVAGPVYAIITHGTLAGMALVNEAVGFGNHDATVVSLTDRAALRGMRLLANRKQLAAPA